MEYNPINLFQQYNMDVMDVEYAKMKEESTKLMISMIAFNLVFLNQRFKLLINEFKQSVMSTSPNDIIETLKKSRKSIEEIEIKMMKNEDEELNLDKLGEERDKYRNKLIETSNLFNEIKEKMSNYNNGGGSKSNASTNSTSSSTTNSTNDDEISQLEIQINDLINYVEDVMKKSAATSSKLNHNSIINLFPQSKTILNNKISKG
jgi:hypothetical protein